MLRSRFEGAAASRTTAPRRADRRKPNRRRQRNTWCADGGGPMNELPVSPEFQLIRAGNPAAGAAPMAPDTALRERILALPRRSRRRRPLIIGAGTTIGIAALAGAAAATGLIPGGVTRAFHSLGDSGNGVRDAHVVAQAATASGIKVQIWVGHNAKGGSCEYTRVVAPNGAEDGGRGCFSAPGMEAP